METKFDLHDYSDIIDLPHHTSEGRRRMSNIERGAQFSPFAALTGYDAAVDEAGRITELFRELSEDEKALMREYNTAWGCDICQTACPHNRAPEITPIAFFRESLIPCLTSECLAGMSKESFSERAFAWRGRATVARNLEILEEK